MRVFAYHGLDGRISGFVTFDGPKHAGLMRASEPGELISELKGVSIDKGERGVEQLRQLAEAKVPLPIWKPESGNEVK
nr:hypothetical protein [Pseudoxanthomonas sp.]